MASPILEKVFRPWSRTRSGSLDRDQSMNESDHALPEASEAALVPLSYLRAGEAGCICGVLGTCDVVHRLREMGLYDGAQIQMVRPGSPCIIRLHGQRLGFRMDDCACVMVRMAALAS